MVQTIIILTIVRVVQMRTGTVIYFISKILNVLRIIAWIGYIGSIALTIIGGIAAIYFISFPDVIEEAQKELDSIKTEEAKTNSSVTN